MRIFVSSSFEDLREHRAAAIRVLRQLGHDVLAMEDMVAAPATPLSKVLDMVDRSEAYVGIFAWRYGYVPGRDSDTPGDPDIGAPAVDGAIYGQTSITHYEYLRAAERKIPVMAFLLDERHPWPPRLVDGFAADSPSAPTDTSDIRTLRQVLQKGLVVSWFTTPSDLEARVSAAVTTIGITRQLDLQEATALDPNAGVPSDTSAEGGITTAIVRAGDHQRALKIDLVTTWWSTRLYLIASLADRLTQAQRFLVVDSSQRSMRDNPPAPGANHTADEQFVGQLSTEAILSKLGPKVPAFNTFREWLRDRPTDFNDIDTEIGETLAGWYKAFGDELMNHGNESGVKVDLNGEVLRRWFGDAMLQDPVHIDDLQRASVIDVLRLLDYPNDFVPVLTSIAPESGGDRRSERVEVMDKNAMNARLARSYLVELMDRARIS